MQEALLVDPITREVLREPVLASDGVTYSLAPLMAAMRADQWHRSPVTREVLRRHVFVNQLALQLLAGMGRTNDSGTNGAQVSVPPDAIALWSEEPEPADVHAHYPDTAVVLTCTLPLRDTATAVLAREHLKLEAGMRLELVAVRASGPLSASRLVLMHPPLACELRAAGASLLDLFGVAAAVDEPCNIATARLVRPVADGTACAAPLTVEEHLLKHVVG